MRFPGEWEEKAKTLKLSADTAEEWSRVYRQLVSHELDRGLSPQDGEVDELLAGGYDVLLEEGWDGMTPWEVSAESPLLRPHWACIEAELATQVVVDFYLDTPREAVAAVVGPILSGLMAGLTHPRLVRAEDVAYAATAKRALNMAEALEIEFAIRRKRAENPDWPRREIGLRF